MDHVKFVLLVFAFVLFVLAGFPWNVTYAPYRVQMIAVELACAVGAFLFG